MSHRIKTFLLAFAFLMAAHCVHAQSNYPTRNIRLLFGFGAGTDVGLRIIAEKLAEQLKRPVIVENISGAAGNIAADQTAYADPDGYAIGLLTGANIVLRPILYRKTPYVPLKRLVPVSLIYSFPNVLVVNNDIKVATLRELIDAARAAPGTMTFGHLGTGSVSHLSGELLKVKAGIDIRAVPYRGVSTLFPNVMTGQITMAFVPPSLALPMTRDGKLRAFAATSRARLPFALDLPTVAEQGYPGFETSIWFGLFVPVGTPQPIVDQLEAAAAQVMRSPDLVAKFAELGLVPIGSTQAEFLKTIAEESQRWTALIQDAKLPPLD
jgi:tripartite-type tricarboxylate transporter receptor subunit TctC